MYIISPEDVARVAQYLNTDSNIITEAPAGNVVYFCANSTHGRIVLQRGSYPLYSCLVSIVKHQVN